MEYGADEMHHGPIHMTAQYAAVFTDFTETRKWVYYDHIMIVAQMRDPYIV
jgi:hypothetical protein